MAASSGGAEAVSPAASTGADGVGCVAAAVGLGEAVGDACSATPPAGTVDCGLNVELIGSYGRLVRNNARKVASAAAAMTLSATTPSRERGGARSGRARLDCGKEVETTTLLRFGGG